MQGKSRKVFGFVVLMATFASARANAQMVGYTVGGNGNYGGGTADGNYLSGASQVIRAEGDYNLLSSQAAVNFEEARSKNLENRTRWTQSYFATREANQAFKAEWFARNRHSSKTLAKVAASGLPRRLNADELDPATGKIAWPSVLRENDYAPLRAELGSLFRARARTRQTQGIAAKIHEGTREMASIVQRNIRNVPASEYLAARKFIDSLDYSLVASDRPLRQSGSESAGD